MKFKIEKSSQDAFFKKMFYLAYQASYAVGMGALHDRPGYTDDQIWYCVKERLSADYVFGRMMKLHVFNRDGVFEIRDGLRGDYQSWCGEYPTVKSLLDAVGMPYESVPETV